MIYLPTSHTITVNLAKMSGPVTAKWFDPTNGGYTTIGTFANTGTHQFTSPSAHSDGSDDLGAPVADIVLTNSSANCDHHAHLDPITGLDITDPRSHPVRPERPA